MIELLGRGGLDEVSLRVPGRGVHGRSSGGEREKDAMKAMYGVLARLGGWEEMG
jgi:hypothetical protein